MPETILTEDEARRLIAQSDQRIRDLKLYLKNSGYILGGTFRTIQNNIRLELEKRKKLKNLLKNKTYQKIF